MDKYFNTEKFNKVFDYFEEDTYKALEICQRYMEEYPKDYSSYPYYSSILIKLGRLDEAEKIIEYAYNAATNDPEYKNSERINKFMSNYYFAKIKIAFYKKNYQECLDMCKEKFDLLYENGVTIKKAIYCCEKRLGYEVNKKVDNYLYSQIVDYKYERFCDHIKKHLYENNQDKELSPAIFSESVNIKTLLNEVKKYIPSDKKILNGIIDNVYIFRYDGCGTVNGKTTNYFKIVTLDDTQEFISMWPIDFGERLPHVDLNYLFLNDTPKVKKLSQIDKFNQRYNK